MNIKEYNDFLETCIEKDMKKQEEQLILKLMKSNTVTELPDNGNNDKEPSA